MKVVVEILYGNWYKLRMMGIPKSGHKYINGDDKSAIHNTSKTKSTLKKKCNVTASHAIHESVAMSKSLTEHLTSEDNPADLVTKVIT